MLRGNLIAMTCDADTTGGCCGRFMASEPDKWDYALAGVPSPLTDELESQQVAKQVGVFQVVWLEYQASRVATISAMWLLAAHVVQLTLFMRAIPTPSS